MKPPSHNTEAKKERRKETRTEKNKRGKGQEQEKQEIPKCVIYRNLDPILAIHPMWNQ